MRSALIIFLGFSVLSVAIAQRPASERLPDVGYVPTSPDAVRAMLRLAGVSKSDVVYDLGSGDGRIVIAAAREFGARGVGIEIDPALVNKARENAKRAGVANRVRFEQNDIFRAKISEATVVTLYLLSTINMELRPKLLRDLAPGVRIVSNTFSMGRDWKPEKMVKADPGGGDNPYLNPTLYLWTVAKRRE